MAARRHELSKNAHTNLTIPQQKAFSDHSSVNAIINHNIYTAAAEAAAAAGAAGAGIAGREGGGGQLSFTTCILFSFSITPCERNDNQLADK